MAQTTKKDLTGSYQAINTLPDFLIQNIGLSNIEIVFKDGVTPPTDTEKGITLKHLDVLTSSIVSGTLYARSDHAGSYITVTE